MPPPVVEEALGGFSAGFIGTILGYPLDVIKTQMQVSGENRNGVLTTGKRIFEREGLRGMYRGVGPPLLSLSILNTTTFAAYSKLQIYYGATRSKWDVKNGLSGASFGLLASMISTVENLIKTQMQIDRALSQEARKYASSLDCLCRISRLESGLFPGSLLYSGHVINTFREMSFLFTYFFVYEGLRFEMSRYSRQAPHIPWWVVPVSGGCAGSLAWAVSFPLDCVRAVVQGRSNLVIPLSAWHTFNRLLFEKGIRGLYSGVQPSIMRAFLVSGTRFSAYEATLWVVRGGRES